MIKLETLRYLLSLTGKEKSRVWKKKNKAFIYILIIGRLQNITY